MMGLRPADVMRVGGMFALPRIDGPPGIEDAAAEYQAAIEYRQQAKPLGAVLGVATALAALVLRRLV